MSKKGYLVISLDFELYWGMFDKVSLDTYGENLKGAHTAIPELLATFSTHGVHATWATVGMLMYKNKKSLIEALPDKSSQPVYSHNEISSYHHIETSDIGIDEYDDPYHFGSSLVKKITETDGQELASHTFSHYYCIDGSENSKAIFAADCNAMQKAADQFGVSLSSIVFPRNQTNENALKVCKEHGLNCYRGTEKHFLYRARRESEQTNLFIRGLRLLDHYINLSGYHTYSYSTINRTITGMNNVPASRFFRPYSHRLRSFESMRLRRIKKAMTHAAQNGEIFHLWWHPHNFGVNRKENMQNLFEILNHYKDLRDTYGFESKNMAEIAKLSLES